VKVASQISVWRRFSAKKVGLRANQHVAPHFGAFSPLFGSMQAHIDEDVIRSNLSESFALIL
jgi:hypothetical protein